MFNNGNGTFGRDQVDALVVTQVQSLGTQGFIYNSENTSPGVGFGTIPVTNSPANTLDHRPLRHGLTAAWPQHHQHRRPPRKRTPLATP